jgi:transposase-like protein
LHTDEKEMKVGKCCVHDINTIDQKTKFVVEEELMKQRSKKKIDRYFKHIKDRVYDQLLEKYRAEKHKPVKKRKLFSFIQDGFENYKSGATKHFFRVCKIVAGVPIACKKYGLEHNNNAIERYNQDIKDRYKTTRHWGSFPSAKKVLKMRQIIHNFVNPHQELDGKTPAEVAEIKYELGKSKLLNLVELAAKLKNFWR